VLFALFAKIGIKGRAYENAVVGCCGRGNEPSDSIKYGEYFVQLRDC
jgi:hypothetical protein